MSRWIEADALEKRRIDYIVDGYADSVDDMVEWGMAIIEAPSINLDDYVPKDFHDKTCEAMAKRHQEEIADTVRVVRCKECRYWGKLNYEAPKKGWCNDSTLYCDGRWTNPDDFCSYGEREGE